MTKALQIFIPTFAIVMVANQMMYGACFKAYCLAAAFPKVVILSLAISTFIYWIRSEEETLSDNIESEDDGTNTETDAKSYSVDSIREDHAKAYAKWSAKEDETLQRLHSEGLSVAEIAEKLERQKGGIRSRLKKHRLL